MSVVYFCVIVTLALTHLVYFRSRRALPEALCAHIAHGEPWKLVRQPAKTVS